MSKKKKILILGGSSDIGEGISRKVSKKMTMRLLLIIQKIKTI